MNAPKVGQIEDGYRFKGGDPADTNNWDEVIEDGYKFTGKNESELGNVDAWVPVQTKKPKERFLEESPEDLAWKDRAIVKNFSNNSKDAAAYLQDKYKDHDVTVNETGDLYMRKKGQTDWKAVDPNTGFFSKDILKDATDIGYDTLAGLGTSAATAAGGIAGAGAGGIGALPTAAAFGGAASGGLETLRQSLGKALGIKQDFDVGNIGMSAGFGAVSPFVFGTGATSKQLLQKGFADNLDSAALVKLAKDQRGGLGRIYDWGTRKVAPKLAQAASGIDSETIKTFAKNLDEIKALEQTGIKDLATESQDEIVSRIGQAKFQKGQRIGQAIDEAGEKVNISGVKGAFTSLKDKLKGYENEINNPLLQEKLKEVLATYDDLFSVAGKKGQEISDTISAKSAFKLQQDLADLAELSKMRGGMLSRLSGKPNVAQKELSEASRSAYNLMNKELDRVTDGLSGTYKAEYKRYSDIQRALAPYFSTPEKTYSTLKGIGSKNKRILRETLRDVDNELGTDILGKAKFLDAFNTFSDASLDPVSMGGVTSTSKTIPMALLGGGAGYYLGDKAAEDMGVSGLAARAIGGALGGFAGSKMGSPAAIRMMIEKGLNAEKAGNALKNLRPVQAAPASAWNYMRGK